MTVKIDGGDRLRIFQKIVQRIASAGRDSKYARILVELEGLNINSRIFPDLVIDKRVKPNREQPLEYTLTRAEALSLNSGL